jgi:hypothetical protein
LKRKRVTLELRVMPKHLRTQGDQLLVTLPRAWGRVALCAFATGIWSALWWAFGPGSPGGLVLLAVGVIALPALAVTAARSVRSAHRRVVRVPGRLLLDGDPLDLARVELRVLRRRFTGRPTGYRLSLWLLTSGGPEDLFIGRFSTLLEASTAAGQLEDFVAKANLRQPGATRAR